MAFLIRGAVVLLLVSLAATACSSPDSTSDLEGRIADLEAELSGATSTTGAPEVAAATTTEPETTTTSEDPLSPDIVRARFDDAMAVAMLTSSALLRQEPELVTAFYTTTHYWFELDPEWSFDIERTDSIISPYSATATIWFEMTQLRLDEDGTPREDPFISRESADVLWAFQDGEWIAKGAWSEEDVVEFVAIALFSLGVSPQSAWDIAENTSSEVASGSAAQPPTTVSALDLTDTTASCSADSIDVSVVVANTSDITVALDGVHFFLGGDFGHSAHDFDDWWPLPSVQPGESASHADSLELGASKPGEEMELLVSWSAGDLFGNEIQTIDCS